VDRSIILLCAHWNTRTLDQICLRTVPHLSAERSSEHPSWWLPTSTVVRYGVPIVAVALAALLMHSAAMVLRWDTRPIILVAVALSALYGGIGPGLLASVLGGAVSHEPGVLLGGLALTLVCRLFVRFPARTGAVRMKSESGLPLPIAGGAGGSIAFSTETRTPPPFIEVTTEATWRFHHEKPLDITLPEDEQVEHLYLYSVLAECNDAFARMYGFRASADVIGTRLVVFCPPSNPENVSYLRAFIRSGYRLEDAESQEIDRYGNTKYFVNNLVGLFERGQLAGAWGTQRDITGQKRGIESQEYRSSIHSAKSSSQ
jgi:hypothetical protein